MRTFRFLLCGALAVTLAGPGYAMGGGGSSSEGSVPSLINAITGNSTTTSGRSADFCVTTSAGSPTSGGTTQINVRNNCTATVTVTLEDRCGRSTRNFAAGATGVMTLGSTTSCGSTYTSSSVFT